MLLVAQIPHDEHSFLVTTSPFVEVGALHRKNITTSVKHRSSTNMAYIAKIVRPLCILQSNICQNLEGNIRGEYLHTCMYIYIYIYIRTYVYIYICTYSFIGLYLRVYIYIYAKQLQSSCLEMGTLRI